MQTLPTVPSRTWLDPELYPFPTRRHTTPDGQLSYVDVGEGPPVVLIHGTPSWSFEWRAVIEGLAKTHRVLAPDHLGFGLSDALGDAPGAPEDHARRLLHWFDALDLREVHVVLHDFGGPIGMPLVLERSERVAGVALLNTWAWALGDRRDTAFLSRVVRSPLGYALYHWLNVSPRWLLPSTFHDQAHLTPDIHRHYLAPFTAERRRSAWLLGCALTGSDPFYATLDARLDELADKRPLLLWGMHDPAFRPEELDRWRSRLRHAEVHELEAGHFPQEEVPDEVVAHLSGWLQRVPSAQPDVPRLVAGF